MTRTHVTVETGLEPADLVRPRNFRPKVPGKHRWLAAASYELSDQQCLEAMRAKAEIRLDHENRVMLTVGCWDCEMPWSEELARTPCHADADDHEALR